MIVFKLFLSLKTVGSLGKLFPMKSYHLWKSLIGLHRANLLPIQLSVAPSFFQHEYVQEDS